MGTNVTINLSEALTKAALCTFGTRVCNYSVTTRLLFVEEDEARRAFEPFCCGRRQVDEWTDGCFSLRLA